MADVAAGKVLAHGGQTISKTETTNKEQKMICDKCGSFEVLIERRMNGNCNCQECGHSWPNRKQDHVADASKKVEVTGGTTAPGSLKGLVQHTLEQEYIDPSLISNPTPPQYRAVVKIEKLVPGIESHQSEYEIPVCGSVADLSVELTKMAATFYSENKKHDPLPEAVEKLCEEFDKTANLFTSTTYFGEIQAETRAFARKVLEVGK